MFATQFSVTYRKTLLLLIVGRSGHEQIRESTKTDTSTRASAGGFFCPMDAIALSWAIVVVQRHASQVSTCVYSQNLRWTEGADVFPLRPHNSVYGNARRSWRFTWGNSTDETTTRYLLNWLKTITSSDQFVFQMLRDHWTDGKIVRESIVVFKISDSSSNSIATSDLGIVRSRWHHLTRSEL